MRGRVIRIERTFSRGGVVEEPAVTTKGYQLADPAHGKHKHHAEHATYVKSLDEAVELIGKGFSLWKSVTGKRPSLIAPRSLRILRRDEAFAG